MLGQIMRLTYVMSEHKEAWASWPSLQGAFKQKHQAVKFSRGLTD